MLKSFTYIFQVLGIIVLLCGYFLSDQPDSLSVMHFDPSSPSFISKSVKSHKHGVEITASQSSGSHRSDNIPRYITYEVILPQRITLSFVSTIETVMPGTHMPHGYEYLYFNEINPPPPRDC